MNYTEIKSAALAYVDCAADSASVAQLDNFLRIIEAKLNRIVFCKDQEGQSYTVLVANTYTYNLPTNYNRLRNVLIRPTITATGNVGTYVPPEFFDQYVSSNGEINIYTLFGNKISIWPVTADYILEILYYKKIVPLDAENTTNWVSINHPDLYIYGLCKELCTFRKDYDTAQSWDAQFMGTIGLLQQENESTKYSGPLYTTIQA